MLYTFYKIICDVDERVYVGCTKFSMQKRWGDHKSCIRTNPKTPFHKEASKIGLEHFSIHLLEIKEFSSRTEATKHEEEYIAKEDSRENGFNGTWARVKGVNGWFGRGKTNDNFTNPAKNPSIGVIQKTSKPCSVCGVEYPSLSHAARGIGIERTLLSYRIKSKSERFKDYFYL